MIDDRLIERAAAADLEAAAELDAMGLLVGREESAAAYGERLDALRSNTLAMREALARDGRYEVEGFTVSASEEIPSDLFEEASAVTRDLYGFAIRWVPGFFINPSFSLLFGGCAFYFYPDFFALFIIRKCFSVRERWLIYSRTELLSHELCHVARLGLMSTVFEETFAYQTATSGFRRMVGSIFRRPSDSFMFLGSALVLLLGQMVRTLVAPWLWIAPFWGVVLLVFAFLIVRHIGHRRVFSRALACLSRLVGGDAGAVLFRCTDEEIEAIATLGSINGLRAWLTARVSSEFRWQVIAHRYPALSSSGSTDTAVPEGPQDS